MQKTITLIFLFLAALQQTSATNLYVNPLVIPNTIPNTYATIPAAIDGASNGDQIFIKPGNYGFNITISKNISLMPDTANGIIDMPGLSISVSLNTGYEVQLIGFNCGSISISSVSAYNAIQPKISIIDCLISGSINSAVGDYETNIFRSSICGNTSIYNGSMIASKTNNLYINNLGQGSVNDTLHKNLIVADTILNNFIYRNEGRKFIIGNNLLKNLLIYSWNNFHPNINRIWNNEFQNGCILHIPTNNVISYNFDISNNVFPANYSFPISASVNVISNSAGSGWSQGNVCGVFLSNSSVFDYGSELLENNSVGSSCVYYGYLWSTIATRTVQFGQASLFPNTNVPGIFIWSYNGISLTGTSNGSYPFTNIPGTTNIVDAGNPDPKYMDIDMTVNDRGRLGGPYSILNYNPTLNPSNGKAYIYDIELPEVISSPTQPIQIKASGYHRN